MQVLTGKEEQRDICSIGLKTVVLEMSLTMATTAVRQLAPKLVSGAAAAVKRRLPFGGRKRPISLTGFVWCTRACACSPSGAASADSAATAQPRRAAPRSRR